MWRAGRNGVGATTILALLANSCSAPKTIEDKPGAVEPIGASSPAGGDPASAGKDESADKALAWLVNREAYWEEAYRDREKNIKNFDPASDARKWLDEHRDQPGDKDPRIHAVRVFNATVLCGEPEEIQPLCTAQGFRELGEIVTEDFKWLWIAGYPYLTDPSDDSFTAVIEYRGLWTVIPSAGPPRPHVIRFVKDGESWKADAVEVRPREAGGTSDYSENVRRCLYWLEESPVRNGGNNAAGRPPMGTSTTFTRGWTTPSPNFVPFPGERLLRSFRVAP